MKKTAKKSTIKKQSKQSAKKFQSFRLTQIENANEVHLAGEFNGWTPMQMEKRGNEFQALVELEPGEYQYKFVVDGQWIDDPSATRKAVNVFGSTNSVIIVC